MPEVTVTYAHVVDVPGPIDMYDALHAEIVRRSGGTVDGLLVHVGRPTATGFQVLEVWQSRAHFDRYNDEVVLPTVADMSAGQPGPAPQQAIEEFAVRGLVLEGGKVVI
ncbi:hypothetical protein BG844_14155 [Couchioplanes caeruleus subsp. caeruleus]|uniref:Antibiotic biosynthesis monooxygenase n=1 Tax=Couchioplanes caeruleus subsp. caeruleus TaxID=56427 RepID=A0A1K0GMS0_9ACTN|nr:hypothetical protein BG844_14155 [Couchioplanes caeruleus subsp. caeruleus]